MACIVAFSFGLEVLFGRSRLRMADLDAARFCPCREQLVLLRIEREPTNATKQKAAQAVSFVFPHANANILNQ